MASKAIVAARTIIALAKLKDEIEMLGQLLGVEAKLPASGKIKHRELVELTRIEALAELVGKCRAAAQAIAEARAAAKDVAKPKVTKRGGDADK